MHSFSFSILQLHQLSGSPGCLSPLVCSSEGWWSFNLEACAASEFGHLKGGCDSFRVSLIREWFGQEWNLRLSSRGSRQEIQGVESGVSWCQVHILKAVSSCRLFSEFQPCASPPAPSSREGQCQRVSVGLLCFVPQTPTSAASTTEAASRSA